VSEAPYPTHFTVATRLVARFRTGLRQTRVSFFCPCGASFALAMASPRHDGSAPVAMPPLGRGAYLTAAAVESLATAAVFAPPVFTVHLLAAFLFPGTAAAASQ